MHEVIALQIGRSTLPLSAISLGLQHNFERIDTFENDSAMVSRAEDVVIGPLRGASWR
ncbi:hypothetical protein HPL003_02295 [Paenibacillus terrae HPL-003]|uniref:Uncharacterized protein n=1 Tax=Paenibacillus terrae (strain HPL-003) TaxID=985665 RepID=G7VZJ8_PAETH|nr:hypothetical protein HPL003_02295 [Paenibacillus terrae HPL-003]